MRAARAETRPAQPGVIARESNDAAKHFALCDSSVSSANTSMGYIQTHVRSCVKYQEGRHGRVKRQDRRSRTMSSPILWMRASPCDGIPSQTAYRTAMSSRESGPSRDVLATIDQRDMTSCASRQARCRQEV